MTPNTRNQTLLAALAAAVIASAALAQQMGAGIGMQPGTPEMAQGRADKHSVGQTIKDGSELHRISRPGLYGISQSPNGSSYGVLDGQLIRYDPDTMQVRSIIREIDRILD